MVKLNLLQQLLQMQSHAAFATLPSPILQLLCIPVWGNTLHHTLMVLVSKQHTDMHQHPLKGHLWRSSKMSGSRKLSNDHSSAKLFWRGVPVRRSLLAALNDLSTLWLAHTQAHTRSLWSNNLERQLVYLINLQLRFLMRWPSSTTRNFQFLSWSCFWSLMHIS